MTARIRWGVLVGVALVALLTSNAVASPPPWAHAKPKPTTTRQPTTTTGATTTTVAPTTTTSAPTTTVGPTTTVAPTTTAGPTTTTLPSCLLTSSFASPQAAVNATPTGGCLTVDNSYALTSPVTITRAMTVQCLSQTNGFTSAGTYELVHISGASGLTFTGCKLESTGPTSSAAGALGIDGAIANVTISNLQVRNVQYGIAGSPVISSIRVTGNDIRFVYAVGIGFYDGQTRQVEIDHNTIVDHQRSGGAGQAGIQSGGISATSNEDRHSGWNIHDNTVQASCNSSDLVGIGMDQLSSSVLADNVVNQTTVCPSEGIVVNGPNNTVLRNQVFNVGAGAYTFISYGTPPQQVRNLTFQGNLADGNNINGQAGQGVALSFAPNALPMTGLLLGGPNAGDGNTLREEQFGIQAYSFGGTVSGSGNTIQGNTLTGNISGPCSIPGGLSYSSINNNPGC